MVEQIVLGRKISVYHLFKRGEFYTVRLKFASLLFIAICNLCLGLGLWHAPEAAAIAPAQTQTQAATQAPPMTVNFQGRLQRNSGMAVDSSIYNIEFKLYNVNTGGKAVWTEDYLVGSGSGVSVDATGYFSVKLGSLTAFPTDMNWNQPLWLTMNVGGVSSTVSWDGEMNPRLQLTAVPYAFEAGKLAAQNGSNTSTLSWDTQTASNTLLLPNKSGTLCVSGDSDGCGFVQGNSSNYIQNTTVPQANSNFNISGDGTIGGNLNFSGQTNANLTAATGLNINTQGGNITMSAAAGSVVAKSTDDTNPNPTFAVQNANAVNLLAAYTGVSLVKIGMGMPTMSSTGLGDLFVSGNGEFGVGLRVGNGQNGLNFAVGYAPSASNGFFNGNSRPTKTLSQMATFSGVTTVDNAKGSLTTGIDTTNNALRNYYNWMSSDTSSQSESMYIQVPVPRDFSALTDNDQLCFNVYTDDTSGNTGLSATFYDTTNTAQTTATVTPDKANQWQRKCTTNIGGTITVDGNTYVTIRIDLAAANNKNIRLSNFSFDYLSAF